MFHGRGWGVTHPLNDKAPVASGWRTEGRGWGWSQGFLEEG